VAAWRRGEGAKAWQQRFSDRLAGPMTIARAAWAIAEAPQWNGLAVRMLGLSPRLIGWLAKATRVPA
jgi:hypothetical protein